MGGSCSRGNDTNSSEKSPRIFIFDDFVEGLEEISVVGIWVRDHCHHTSLYVYVCVCVCVCIIIIHNFGTY